MDRLSLHVGRCPYPSSVGKGPAREGFDPLLKICTSHLLRHRQHVHALTSTDRNLGVEHNDAHLGSRSDVSRVRGVRRGNPVEPPVPRHCVVDRRHPRMPHLVGGAEHHVQVRVDDGFHQCDRILLLTHAWPLDHSGAGMSQLVARSRASGGRRLAAHGGRRTENREPSAGRLSASIRPPRDSTMRRARARPRPAPAPERAGSARKNGSNTRSRSSGASPSPVSSTATSSPSGERDAWTRTVPSAGVWRTAFTSRFWRTRVIRGEQGASSAPFRLVTSDSRFSRAWTSTAATAEFTISTRRALWVSVSMAPSSSWTISNRSSTMLTSWLTDRRISTA